MRFMMLVLPGIGQDEGDWSPSAEDVEAMTKYNEQLTKAGVLLALDGLHPTSKGARVTYAGGRPAVTDGPFAGAEEVIGGYWLIDVRSKDEAVEWATRCPLGEGDILEVRQVYEVSDFSDEVRSVDVSGVEPAER